jgi:O-antigen/teichoic acid export membrane protein
MISWNSIVANKYNKNTLFILAEKGVSLPFNFITFIILARQFGPTEFGLMSYGLSLVAILAPLSKFAYDTVITKYLSMGYSIPDLLKTSIKLRVLGSLSVMSFLIGYALIFIDNPSLEFFVILVSITIIIEVFTLYDSVFQVQLRSQYSSYAQSTSLIIGSSVRICIALSNPDIILIGWSLVGERVISVAMRWYFYQTNTSLPKSTKVNNLYSKELFIESLPLILTNLLILINFKADQILIAYFMNESAVGIYAAAVRYSEVWYMIPIALMTSYFPYISKNIDQESLVRKTIIRLSSSLTWAAVFIAICTSLLGPWLIEILFGKSYEEAAIVLSIHIWASVFFFLGHPMSKVLIAKKKTWIINCLCTQCNFKHLANPNTRNPRCSYCHFGVLRYRPLSLLFYL